MSAFATRQTLPLVEVTTCNDEERRWSCQDCDWSGTAVDAGLEPGDFPQHCPECRRPPGERANLEARTYPELDTFDDCFERLRALVAQCDPEQLEAMRRRMFEIGNEIIAEAGTESGDPLQCARYDAGELLPLVAIAYNEACATCGLPADIHLGPDDPPVPTPHVTWGDRNKCRQFVRCDPPRFAYAVVDVPEHGVTMKLRPLPADRLTLEEAGVNFREDGIEAEAVRREIAASEALTAEELELDEQTLEHAMTTAEAHELHARGLGSESSGESILAALREIRAEEARQPDRTETWTADYGVVRAGAHVIIDGRRYRIMRTRPELPQPGDRYELDLEDLGPTDSDLQADADGNLEVTLPADKGPHTNALHVGSTHRDGPQFLEEPTREELEDDEDLGP